MSRLGRIGLLLLLCAYVVVCALLFAYASLLSYAQLTLYAGLNSSGRAGAYLEVNGPLPEVSTPALVYVCRDLMGKVGDGVKLGEGAVQAMPELTITLKNLKSCEPSLLMRGDSVDLALLGWHYAYLWAATKDERHRKSAFFYISRSNAASPRRSDTRSINAKSRDYLSR
jgi:hypothetical protein